MVSLSSADQLSRGNSGSWRPIQDISSSNTKVFLRLSIRSPRSVKADIQESGKTCAPLVCAQSRSPKLWSWSALVCPLRGPRPSMTMSSSLFRRANSLNSVDLPMRRRPRQATNDDVGLSSSNRSDSSSSSRPKNIIKPFGEYYRICC